MLSDNYDSKNQVNYNKSNAEFYDTLDHLTELYKPAYQNMDPKTKLYTIEPQDMGLLSKYETNVLRNVARLVGIVTSSSNNISYDELMTIINKLGEHKLDIEKAYLMSLFFPEKVKASSNLFPFPVPTYTYVQKIQFFIVPNSKGAFLVQAVCPILLSSSSSSSVSNLYTNISPLLDGTTLLQGSTPGTTATYVTVDGTNLVALNTKSPSLAFNAFTLQSMKISCRYVGRVDVISGYFGGSFHLSTTDAFTYDYAPTQFNFVDDSLNATIADVSEGLNVIYYPPDFSYLNFNGPDVNSSSKMSTNMRLNLYGQSLPTNTLTGGAAGVILTFTAVWNVIPTPGFSDLIPVDSNPHLTGINFTESAKFVQTSNLGAHKLSDMGSIERLLNLPTPIRENALKDYHEKKKTDSSIKNILDVVKPVLGDSLTKPIYLDKSFFDMYGGTANRKKAVESLNNAITKY